MCLPIVCCCRAASYGAGSVWGWVDLRQGGCQDPRFPGAGVALADISLRPFRSGIVKADLTVGEESGGGTHTWSERISRTCGSDLVGPHQRSGSAHVLAVRPSTSGVSTERSDAVRSFAPYRTSARRAIRVRCTPPWLGCRPSAAEALQDARVRSPLRFRGCQRSP
jgi:hypothetical protein